MKKFKYITIREYPEIKKYPNIRFEIVSNKNGVRLGYILWETRWKQYVFSQSQGAVIWSVDCLQDIIKFIEEIK